MIDGIFKIPTNRCNLRKYKFFTMIVLAILLSMTFHVELYENMDFARHSMVMNHIRSHQLSLEDFLHNAGVISDKESSSNTYAFNILEWFFSTYFSNNYVLVWFMTGIDYAIIAYIAYDLKRNTKYSVSEVLMAIGICFGYLPFIHVVSGLRTANAMCLAALGIYILLCKEKNVLLSLAFFFVAITVHEAVIIPIGLAIVVKIFPYKIMVFIVGIGSLFIAIMAKIMMKINISFVKVIVNKYITYTGDKQFKGFKFCFYGSIFFSIIYIFHLCWFGLLDEKRKKNGISEKIQLKTSSNSSNVGLDKIDLLLAANCAFILGNTNGYELVHRSAYLFGCLAPVLAIRFHESCSRNDNAIIALFVKIAIYILLLPMWGLNIYHYYMFFT